MPARLPQFNFIGLNQVCSIRAVRITTEHIETIMAKRRRGEITDRQMVQWAHMVAANDAYFWQAEDDEVATWVNFLIFDLRPED